MNAEPTFEIGSLYGSHREFRAQLDAALEHAHNDFERERLEAIDFRYEDEGELAELTADEHDLIERLARERSAIGPTDV